MLKENEIISATTDELEIELEKAQRFALYYEMADSPQYSQAQETKDRNANKAYLRQIHAKLKRRKESK